MPTAFFVAAFVALVLPPLIHRRLRLGRWMPLVFLQLLLGMGVTASGLTDALQADGIDLRDGALADSLRGIGTLGLCLLIAIGGRHRPVDGTNAASGDRRFVSISVAGFGCTALVGVVVGWMLAANDPSLLGPRATRIDFAAATGLLLSVTALPVLMAIVDETGLGATAVGRLAMRAASLDDLWLWLSIAALLASSGTGTTGASSLAWAGAGFVVTAIAAVVFAFGLVRPALVRWLAARERGRDERLVASLAIILLSSAATQAIGLHAVLGAFVGGALLPEAALAGWREPLLAMNRHLLLPFFFLASGLAVRLAAGDAAFWALVAVLTVTATGVKFAAASIAARIGGLRWTDALTIGSLMQCKGLMELAAVAVLQQAGVVGVRMGSALAVMAVVGTLVTAPAVRLFRATPAMRLRVA